jgi:hypothetical protein
VSTVILYRAKAAHGPIADARAELAIHRMAMNTGRCQACGEYAPCTSSNAAFADLVRYGAATGDDNSVRVDKEWPQFAPLLMLGALRRAIRGRE